MDKPEFDAYGDSYSDKVNEAIAFAGLKVDFFTAVKADYLLDLCRRQFGHSNSLSALDVGCGVGNIHPKLAPEFADLTGIDPSEICLERARRQNPDVDYVSFEGEIFPLDSDSVDVCFTICVMHHVPPPQWQQFVGEMVRVTKPGGLVVVFEHNPRNPLTQRVVNNCEFDKNAVLLNCEKLNQLFSATGIQVVGLQYILSIPAKGVALRAVDRLLSPLGLGAQYMVWGQTPQ